ncbi:LANO_0G00408g1_1 [Lachancea nothofagi CBS 11611]|uniref:LANO_0G00408g1_1 n=1 Tax=Lachancea nothofagi CBS 11611 TaxID=1266666 RepID=A0A1G4KED1_9SACH|nr:LANO_0G00408g1_1 [Lachancea nothofagi CBS 11611]
MGQMATEPNVLPHIFRTSKIFDDVDASTQSELDKSIESRVISGLESVAGLFDDVHLLRSLGIIGENNYFYRKLNKGGVCSKVWLVSLVLSLRKYFADIFQLAVSRSRLKKEEQHFKHCASSPLRKVLCEKISLKIQEIDKRLRLTTLELLQTVAYLLLVVVDVFAIKLSEKWKRILDRSSGFFTVLKFLVLSVSSTVS